MEKQPRKKKTDVDELRTLLNMLRDCGVTDFSKDGMTVRILPKALEESMRLPEDIDMDLSHAGLMGETTAKLRNSKEEYEKDLFWSR